MIKNLLVPLDGTDLSERAMRESIELARQLGASITGFVAEPDVPLPHMGKNMAQYRQERDAHQVVTDTHAHALLAQFGERAQQAGVPFTARHQITDRVDAAIVDLAEQLEDGLIVMVTHGRGVFAGLLFGSHTRNVMALTKVPLLVLH
ncbi:MAG: universal stress protein [Aquincola sp.]|nr:universal stress protein [Aquincola sp.]MDH4290414.1 universal stress protein [Aquincola sp.]MDH5329273.1 universal stress protein [Aquincola sp.]